MRAFLVFSFLAAATLVASAAPVPKQKPQEDPIQPGFRWWDHDFDVLLEAVRVDGEVVTVRNPNIPVREYHNLSQGLKTNQIYKKDIRAMLNKVREVELRGGPGLELKP